MQEMGSGHGEGLTLKLGSDHGECLKIKDLC